MTVGEVMDALTRLLEEPGEQDNRVTRDTEVQGWFKGEPFDISVASCPDTDDTGNLEYIPNSVKVYIEEA